MPESGPERNKNYIKPALKSPLNKNKLEKKQSFKLGPVKVFIVDARNQYCKTVWFSIWNAVSQMTIGAVNAVALGYTIFSGDIHVILCTAAWHFFTAEAIFALSFTNGWGSPMTAKNKKVVHIVFQVLGLVCLVSGAVLVYSKSGERNSNHAITGLTGLIMTCVTIVSGPAATIKNHAMKLLHVCVALPTFIIASVCVCFGLITESFQKWTGEVFSYVLICFVVFYTLFIFVTNIIKCYMRIKYIRLS